MVQLLPCKTYMIVQTALMCERCCSFHVAAVKDFREKGCESRRIGEVQEVFIVHHAGTKGYIHLYWRCPSLNVFDTRILCQYAGYRWKNTHIKDLASSPVLDRLCSADTLRRTNIKYLNLTVKIWFWCLSFLFCFTERTNTASARVCIMSHLPNPPGSFPLALLIRTMCIYLSNVRDFM